MVSGELIPGGIRTPGITLLGANTVGVGGGVASAGAVLSCYTAAVFTASDGTASFYATNNGLVGGTPVFSTVISFLCCAVDTASGDPLASAAAAIYSDANPTHAFTVYAWRGTTLGVLGPTVIDAGSVVVTAVVFGVAA